MKYSLLDLALVLAGQEHRYCLLLADTIPKTRLGLPRTDSHQSLILPELPVVEIDPPEICRRRISLLFTLHLGDHPVHHLGRENDCNLWDLSRQKVATSIIDS